jgi:hypothetical protein
MRSIAIFLITLFTLSGTNAFALSTIAAPAAKVEQESIEWRKVAEAIPLGSKVKIHTLDGKRISGTLVRVDDKVVTLKKNTRLPEPAVTIAYDRVENLERDHGNMNWAKAVGIGLGAGAGVFLTMFVIALQID